MKLSTMRLPAWRASVSACGFALVLSACGSSDDSSTSGGSACTTAATKPVTTMTIALPTIVDAAPV